MLWIIRLCCTLWRFIVHIKELLVNLAFICWFWLQTFTRFLLCHWSRFITVIKLKLLFCGSKPSQKAEAVWKLDICLDMGIGGLLLTTIIVGAFHVPRCAWNIGSFTFLKDPDKDTTFDRNSIATPNTLNNNSDHNHEAPKCDPRTIKELEILQLQLWPTTFRLSKKN